MGEGATSQYLVHTGNREDLRERPLSIGAPGDCPDGVISRSKRRMCSCRIDLPPIFLACRIAPKLYWRIPVFPECGHIFVRLGLSPRVSEPQSWEDCSESVGVSVPDACRFGISYMGSIGRGAAVRIWLTMRSTPASSRWRSGLCVRYAMACLGVKTGMEHWSTVSHFA